jgi:hypothetical protein
MKRRTYEHLHCINQSFEEVLNSLRALRKHPALDENEVRRVEDLMAETRAGINSYLLESFATVETGEAGRLFRKRLKRERKEEQE